MSADSAKKSVKFIDKVLRRTEIIYIWQDHSLKKKQKGSKVLIFLFFEMYRKFERRHRKFN